MSNHAGSESEASPASSSASPSGRRPASDVQTRSQLPPVRKWYYLNGYFRNPSDGSNSTDPAGAKFPPDAWVIYDAEIQFLLSDSYATLVRKGAAEEGRVLDLSVFTDPPLNYSVFRAREVRVRHPNAAPHLRGRASVAGFSADFWKRLGSNSSLLPKAVAQWVDMGVAKVVGGFYQLHNESGPAFEQLMNFLQDSAGQLVAPATEPRKRIVLLVEFPPNWHDASRIRPADMPQADVAALADGQPPVYEWWYGDRPSQADCGGQKPRGFWKRYHPTLCRRLEQAWQSNVGFQDFKSAIDVDGVRYMVTRISAEHPFDGTCIGAEAGPDPFTAADHVTIDYPCWDQLDRATGNCLVQFYKGNPVRRRPARRRINAEEIARNAARTGDMCSICFSDEGELTGCAQMHVVCSSCLRSALRAMIGDIFLPRLVCGCFEPCNQGPLRALAERADKAFASMMSSELTTENERMEREMELQECRRQFALSGDVPLDLYTSKLEEYFDNYIRHRIAPDYYVCVHPDCGNKVENWMLRMTFDNNQRLRGEMTWYCPDGHKNAVLPSASEIRDINKSLLLHPEYYTGAAEFDGCPMHRYRICPGCVNQGLLTLAEHADGCKQWPGYGQGHQHCFCFSCTKTWGSDCGHGRKCADPGVQQVRSNGNELEIGFVNVEEYMSWLKGEVQTPPPTFFSSEPCFIDGASRQKDLEMLDREALLKESQSGTS